MKAMKEVNRKKRRLGLENPMTGCICPGRSPLFLQGMEILPSFSTATCCTLKFIFIFIFRCNMFLRKFVPDYTALHSIR
jgi:hypothetical protein